MPGLREAQRCSAQRIVHSAQYTQCTQCHRVRFQTVHFVLYKLYNLVMHSH